MAITAMTNSTTSRRSGKLVIFLVGGVLLACGGGGGAKTGGDPVPSYSLTIQVSGDGSTTPAAGTFSHPSGTVVEVAATPASGSVFAGWSGAATGTSSPVSVTMDGDKTLTAT